MLKIAKISPEKDKIRHKAALASVPHAYQILSIGS
jgi:hypothetical protein